MAESQKVLKQRVLAILEILEREFPVAVCELDHRNPFELVVATILSAQCTDRRVNMVTPHLFSRFPDAFELQSGTLEEIETLIQSTGFFRAKAKNLSGLGKALVKNHSGEVPQTLDKLVLLPGVGRKTANVVLGVAFRIAVGIVVDTHVRRITNLLGLTQSQNVEIIERDLMKLLPRSTWIDFSHRIILHGRKTCIARRPRCTECPLLSVCPRIGLSPLVPQ